jgi:DNA invertase Pin-like site-specific DNA recombinase
MIRLAEKQKLKIIICEKADRLSRNFKDVVLVDEWLDADEERQVHLVKDSLILHKNSRSQEKLNWGIRIIFAKNHIDNLSEEVKKGQKEKLSQGWLPTKAPIGYKTIGEKGHKIHAVDPETAPFVRKIFELYASGNYSLSAITEIAYKEGLRNSNDKGVVKSRIHTLISDPFYCGKIRWNGKVYEGKHEALISKELFDQVQQKLIRGTAAPTYRKHRPIFKGKISCEECGGTITWEKQKGHWYGHCNHYKQCTQKAYARQENVEEQLFDYFIDIAPKNERVLAWLEKTLKDDHREEIEYHATKKAGLTLELERSERRLGALYDDKLDGKISVDFYEKKFAEITAAKETALEQLNTLNKDQNKYYEAGFAIHELALKAYAIYNSSKAEVDEKRLLLSQIFSNLAIKDRKINPSYTFAFNFLKEWMPRVNMNFEPRESIAVKGKTGVLPPVHPILLG